LKNFPFILILFNVFGVNSQSKQIQVLDSLSKEPIPYTSVYFSNNKGLITDETGYFELLSEQVQDNDSLFVSFLGYDGLAVGLKKLKDSILYMTPKAIALEDVILMNKSYSSEKILALVKSKLEQNYSTDYSKKRLFYKSFYAQNIEKLEITKYKTSIPELNRALVDSFLMYMPRSNEYTTETLAYYSGNFEEDNQKINLIKARQTFDKGGELFNALQEGLGDILKDNLKPNSYFKVKSGLFFGADMDISGLEKVDSTDINKLKEFEKKKAELNLLRKENFAKYRKENIAELYSELFFAEDSDLNVIKKPNRYKFSVPEVTLEDENLIYIIRFRPSDREDFEGTLHINAEDFAVTRLDFNNVKALFKLKLLGVSINQNLKGGRMIFSKDKNNKYALSYLQITKGSILVLDRPIKFIEKNKFVRGRRKQNRVSMRLKFAVYSKTQHELRVFDYLPINQEVFEAMEEKNDVLPKYYDKFTTNFWEEF
tara:strand:- start:163 stop:1617 length:1455 start_codon:yes stop_codon:yes gene_type:complete